MQQDSTKFSFHPFTGAMLSAGAVAYTYDALGRRAVEAASNGPSVAYIWDGSTIIAHGDSSNWTIDIPTDDIDGHIASFSQNGTGAGVFYHQGRDMSVLATSNEGGLIEGYSYSAFGEPTVLPQNGQNPSGNRLLFQGQLYDPQTRTYSMRSRQYQPRWGRFLSPDPLSFTAAPSLYSFTGSRPLSARDPLGLCDITDGYTNCDSYGSGSGWLGAPLPAPAPLPYPGGFTSPPPPSGGYHGGYTPPVVCGVNAPCTAPPAPAPNPLQHPTMVPTGGGSRGTPGAVDESGRLGPYDTAWQNYFERKMNNWESWEEGLPPDPVGAHAWPPTFHGSPIGVSWHRPTAGETAFAEVNKAAAILSIPLLLGEVGTLVLAENSVPVFRVEGTINQRLVISGGDVSVEGRNMLFLNFGDRARAEAFLAQRLAQGLEGVTIKSFAVPRAFFEELSASAVPENFARYYPTSPLVVDVTKAANQFGLRGQQIEELLKVIIPGSGQ